MKNETKKPDNLGFYWGLYAITLMGLMLFGDIYFSPYKCDKFVVAAGFLIWSVFVIVLVIGVMSD